MEIDSLDAYLYEIRVRQVEYRKHYPLNFWVDVAEPWFTRIGPPKARQYGFEAFLKFGPKAHIVDICGCYYRWKNMAKAGVRLYDHDMMNALRDGFGYGVILSVMTGHLPDWESLLEPPLAAAADIDQLVFLFWEGDLPIDQRAVTMAHRIPVAAYDAT